MDEVIGAGDHHFIEKSRRRLNELIETASILAIASHDESILRKFCNKGLFLQNGELMYFGDIESTIEQYNAANA
jgi:ABC-type polysaccharide/polyol phosphate transport system ATPase subunit